MKKQETITIVFTPQYQMWYKFSPEQKEEKEID